MCGAKRRVKNRGYLYYPNSIIYTNLSLGSSQSLINDASASTIITDAHAEELGQGFKMCQPDFKVQVTSHFGVDDLDDFLFGEGFGLEKVPRAWFQVINIKHGEGTELLD